MEPAALRQAGDLLFGHWQNGSKMQALPGELRPATRAEGYAVQAGLEARSTAPLAGWKIAATSKAGQAHIGVDGPLAGRILAERVLAPGSSVSLRNNLMRVAEAEFAFRMRGSLQPRDEPFTLEEVLAAVGDMLLTIEIPDSRFSDFTKAGAASLIADNACAHKLVVGPDVGEPWRDLDLANWPVTARIAGKGEWHGVGGNVLGDPRVALAWIANELRSHGITLGAGQLVTTGTCVAPVAIEPDDVFEADFGRLGHVRASFVD